MSESEAAVARAEESSPLGWLESFAPFADLFGRRNRWIEEFFADQRLASVMPKLPIDVTESEKEYVVTAEVAGVDKKDLTIECKGGVLSIRGEKKSEREETRDQARVLERSYGAFSRTLALPEDADLDHVSASFKDGVLRIEIQKRPGPKSKTIAIKG